MEENTGSIIEDFENCGEEGSGEKLLHLLQKMGVENILVIINVKHFCMPGELGSEMFKMVIDRAKELLTSLHLKVLEAERIE